MAQEQLEITHYPQADIKIVKLVAIVLWYGC